MKKFKILFVAICMSNFLNAQNITEVKTLNSGFNSYSRYICSDIDSNGNIFIGGLFEGTQDVNPDPNNSTLYNGNNSFDFFIAKYSPFGVLLWSHFFDTKIGGYYPLKQLKIDNNGDVLALGFFSTNNTTTFDLDPSPSVSYVPNLNNGKMYIAKYSGINGNLIWVKQFNGSREANNKTDLDIDHHNNIVLAHIFLDTFDVNPDTTIYQPIYSKGWIDICIVKLSEQGQFLFSKQIGGLKHDVVNGVEIDSQDNIIIGGTFQETTNMDIGASNLLLHVSDTPLNTDIFIVKYSPQLDLIFAKNIGNNTNESVNDLELDDAGNIYFCGEFSDKVDFDPDPVSTNFGMVNLPSTNAGYLCKWTNNGEFVWKNKIGFSPTWNMSYNTISQIALDKNSNIYITGIYGGSIFFDAFGYKKLFKSINSEIYVFFAKYNSQGFIENAMNVALSPSWTCELLYSPKINQVINFGMFSKIQVKVNGINKSYVSEGVESFYFMFFNSFPLSINQPNDSQQTISIFPNPTSGNLMIDNYPWISEAENITIYSVLGQKIMELPFASTIDVSRLSEGNYFYQVYTSSGQKYTTPFKKVR